MVMEPPKATEAVSVTKALTATIVPRFRPAAQPLDASTSLAMTILNALEAKALPIYGDGQQVRDWLHVQDHCVGIWKALNGGRLGEKYNIGGNNEHPNIEIVDLVCGALEELRPAKENPAMVQAGVKSYTDLKTFVKDRPGHDRRYAIDSSKIAQELGWKSEVEFSVGIKETARWYLANADWCRAVQEGAYDRERLGLREVAE